MLDAAETAGIVHLLGTEFRWSTGQASMARVITRGEIGTPKLATFILHIPMLADPAGEVPAWWSDAGQGGGWLGAQAAHVVDQVQYMFGEIEGVSASLSQVSARDWDVEARTPCTSVRAPGSTASCRARVARGDRPCSAHGSPATSAPCGPSSTPSASPTPRVRREIPAPADLPPAPPEPPASDLLATAYDGLHAFGIDVPPYTRLCTTFLDLIEGRPVPDDPRPATFADGLAAMRVLDAIRRSAREHAWVEIPTTHP